MANVEKHKDPRTRKEILILNGVIDGVYFNEIKNPKAYSGGWSPTHSINVVVEGTKLFLGLTDKDSINAKDDDGNWHELMRGVEISAEVEETGEYKGVMGYSSKASKIVVLDASNAQPRQDNKSTNKGGDKSTNTYKPKDMTGVLAGMSLNGAINFLCANPKSKLDVLEVAKSVFDISQDVKEQYKEDNPKMSDYDVGAAVGNSILNACRTVTKVKDIEKKALELLNDVVPEITEYIKNGGAPKEDEDQQEESPSYDDLDDDIPF